MKSLYARMTEHIERQRIKHGLPADTVVVEINDLTQHEFLLQISQTLEEMFDEMIP